MSLHSGCRRDKAGGVPPPGLRVPRPIPGARGGAWAAGRESAWAQQPGAEVTGMLANYPKTEAPDCFSHKYLGISNPVVDAAADK